MFSARIALISLSLWVAGGCTFQPTRETLIDEVGNKTYCASQAAINTFINTTIVHACTPDNPKTVVTFTQGNSIGGAILSTGTAAAAAATGLGLGFK